MQQLFDHYEKLSFSYYDQNNSGQMMSKLVSDLFDIAEFAHHGPENLFISLIKIVGSFIFLFLINWQLAIPLLILVFCMLVFSISQNNRMQATFMDNRRKIGDVNASLQDTLAGIRVVQSFANEDVEREKFGKSNQAFLLSKDANYRCMGKLYGMESVLPGHDVSGHLGLRRISDRPRTDGCGRSGHVRPLYRHFYQPHPDPGGADGNDAERPLRLPPLSRRDGDRAGDPRTRRMQSLSPM